MGMLIIILAANWAMFDSWLTARSLPLFNCLYLILVVELLSQWWFHVYK